tara:strand:+ start:8794 stop:9771 length:978 start_codon:yes stop_codon:yes gene_type:complete
VQFKKTTYLSIVSLTLILFVLIYILKSFNSELGLNNKILTINSGDNLKTISSNLEKIGATRHTLLVNIYMRISGKETEIKTGEYLLKPDMNLLRILHDISLGNNYYRDIRIKESSTFKELIAELRNSKGLVDDLGSNPEAFLSEFLAPFSLEGVFAPETYFYKYGDTYSNLLKRAFDRQNLIVDKYWELRSMGLPYESKSDLLILASIVEKEGEEKELIAGVFLRRLLMGMKLQTDPTVIYAMGNNYHGNITKKDLRMQHPYNTYFIKGLPPGPISYPSQSSIQAASILNDEEYLYFVSKGDGTHYFSKSYEEHLKAVKKYQLGQ